MAYNENFPADDSYLSDFPAGDREQNRALKDDQIVNAGKLQGLTAGNENGQIPINNGTENTNLNAALLNGKASNYFATSNHTHDTATQSSNGYMSNSDKTKLDGIASGAEVNQNAFANVKVGSTTIQADSKQDTLELAAGTNIALTPDGNNDKVTIGVTGKVASATTADKVSATASDGGVADLVYGNMAGNDFFRIRIGGSSNVGYAEIATADNGNEPIYITQYSDDFATATRTATLLDGNGNTSFPGKVTANGGCSLGSSLNLANNTLNLAGDDCYFGDQNVAGGFCLKGASDTTKLVLINKDNPSQMATLSYAGGNLISSATIQSNIEGTATRAIQDRNGLQIDANYLKNVTANNATLFITKGDGSTSTTTIDNVSRANFVTVSQSFNFGAGDGNFLYSIFARTYLDAGFGYGNSTFLITSTGNFGSNVLGSYIVNISNRGGARMYVKELIPDGSNSTTFGYYQDGSFLYFGFCSGGFCGERSVTPLHISSGSGHEVGNFKNDSNIPQGWTPVVTEKTAPLTSPAFSGTPTAPTSDTWDYSNRVATTGFVRNLLNSGSFGTISAANLNETGYVQFSNGLILQWGRLTKTSWDTFSGNFPIAFNSCYAAIGVANDTGYTGCSFNNTSINVRSRWESSNASNIASYIAIGK